MMDWTLLHIANGMAKNVSEGVQECESEVREPEK